MKWNFQNKFRNDEPDGADYGGGDGVEFNDSTQQDDSSPGLSDEIRSAISDGFAQVARQNNQPQQQRQLSPEEVNKALKYYEPDEAFVKRFRDALAGEHGTGALRAVLKELATGMYGHVNQVSQLLVQQARGEIDQRYHGLDEHIQTQKREANKKAFFKEYPSLAPFAKLMPAAAQQVGDVTGKSPAEVRKMLAEKAVELIKQVNPTAEISISDTTVNRGSNPRPAAMSKGGMGGSGSSQQTKRRSSGIWD